MSLSSHVKAIPFLAAGWLMATDFGKRPLPADAKTIGITLVLYLGLLRMFRGGPSTRSRRDKEEPSVAAAPRFDDPTLDDTEQLFDPSRWTLVRKSDSDFTWKEQDHPCSRITGTFDRNKNVNAGDLVLRGLLPPFRSVASKTDASTSREASKRGAEYYAHVAQGYGCVPNDYGGPMFLLPGLVIASYVTGEEARQRVLNRSNRKAMIAYILNHQQEDGGWGTHVAGTSTNFGSVLNYTALRLLGVRATHPSCCKARMFLAQREGALGAPLWAKLWLAVLGCYDYRGMSPVPPEMWLLPDWFPFHPGKTWCHARLVALPMSYLYGKRFVYPDCETDATVIQLRTELYPQHLSYDSIEWEKYGDHLCGGELYGAVPGKLMRFGNFALRILIESTFLGNSTSVLRSAALKRAWKHVKEEDENNDYLDIGPVNKALNLVCAFAEGDAKAVSRHVEMMERYLWVAEDGMKMQGYINPMVWDSSFTLLSLCSLMKTDIPGDVAKEDQRDKIIRGFARTINEFLCKNQLDRDPREHQEYRDPSLGGWGFSTKENTYIVSDCTAEALRAILVYSATVKDDSAMQANVNAAVDLILWMQNPDDNAWASYEKRRGHSWYELLNPAAVFGDIMIDYSYVECTSSCIQALVSFLKYGTEYSLRNSQSGLEHKNRVERSRNAVRKATGYLFNQQRADGSFFGQWGVCFTYATLFAVEALAAARDVDCVDEAESRKSLGKAARFLLAMQNKDGGWGESVDGCALKIWVPDPTGSNVVNTAWALMTLVRILKSSVLAPDMSDQVLHAANQAAVYLMRQQTPEGDWLQQASISGVFNKTCGITYTSYRNSFPIWALAEFGSLK